jgi:transposase
MLLTLIWWPKRKWASSTSASKTDRTVSLTDKQWALIADLFPWSPPTSKGGRPRAHPRDCLEGVLWILVTGARWKDLPNEYPSKATCHRRFQQWTEEGLLERVWQRLLKILDDSGQIDWSELFADGTFSSAKKGVNR